MSESKICGKCKKLYDESEEFASDIACGECESKAIDALIAITLQGRSKEDIDGILD